MCGCSQQPRDNLGLLVAPFKIPSIAGIVLCNAAAVCLHWGFYDSSLVVPVRAIRASLAQVHIAANAAKPDADAGTYKRDQCKCKAATEALTFAFILSILSKTCWEVHTIVPGATACYGRDGDRGVKSEQCKGKAAAEVLNFV